MLQDKVQKALNKQLNSELYASYLYLAMSAYFESESLDGFAKWMRLQSSEEYMHAMKIYDFIHQRGGKVTLTQIDTPKTSWSSVKEVFEDVYKHEQSVTKSIHELVELSIAEKDHASNTFLHWFVDEQVEEESTSLNILDKIKFIGDNKSGLYLLNRELGSRTQ